MKTPHAILIGLSLIAVAIFFKYTLTSPAHALMGPRGLAGFSCTGGTCYIVDNNSKVWVWSDAKWRKFM